MVVLEGWLSVMVVYGIYILGHSRLGYYFWDKGLKDFVALDLGVYHDLLLFNKSILMR